MSDLTPPPKTSVELPLGIYDPVSGLVDKAEVKELNGWDEEHILRGNTPMLQAVLERGVVSINGQKPTRDILDALPMCDRVELLLAIRVVTWGELSWEKLPCPSCSEEFSLVIPLENIPRRELSDRVADRVFDKDLKIGTASVTFPSGALHRKIMSMSNTSSAEMATALIADCVVEIEGREGLVGESLARAMSIADRVAVVQEISSKTPGMLLDEVKAVCPHCEQETPFPLAVGAMFPL